MGSQMIQIIILAGIALFLILRLRNVLGSREGFEKPEPYTIVRDVVKVESVESKLLEPGYAYLRLRSFQERTSDDHECEQHATSAHGRSSPLVGLQVTTTLVVSRFAAVHFLD